MADITMPQLGETVTEGTITRWLKQVGEEVALDEPLFEVSTDKVDSEVPSPSAGVLTQILVQEGQTVDVGARLAVVGDTGAAPPPPAPVEAPPAAATIPAAAPEPPAAPPPPVAETPQSPTVATAPPPPAPAPTAPAVEQTTPAAEVERDDAGSNLPARANGLGTRGALLSPVVRRLIADNGLDTGVIPGTGLGGRITRDDVLAYLDTQAARPPQAATAPVAAAAPTAEAAKPVVAAAPHAAVPAPPTPLGVRDEIVPFGAIRRVTAEHMVRSKATSAHALVATETDFENVEHVRKALKERFFAEEGVNLTYLPFIARAVVDVLRDYPNLNSSVGDDALVVHKDIHLGFAVDLEHHEGLMVPVVHNADGLSLRGMARSIADLASRARSRKLSIDDITGGTFTITNPGPFGTFLTVPIIAQPQVAILSTDGVKRRPVVLTSEGSESIGIHPVGNLAMSFDHRAVDGAYVAAFLRDLVAVIATRDWSAEF